MYKFIIIENTDKSKIEFARGGYGQTETVISKEQLQALIDGKALAFNDGEYTHVIYIGEDVE